MNKTLITDQAELDQWKAQQHTGDRSGNSTACEIIELKAMDNPESFPFILCSSWICHNEYTSRDLEYEYVYLEDFQRTASANTEFKLQKLRSSIERCNVLPTQENVDRVQPLYEDVIVNINEEISNLEVLLNFLKKQKATFQKNFNSAKRKVRGI